MKRNRKFIIGLLGVFVSVVLNAADDGTQMNDKAVRQEVEQLTKSSENAKSVDEIFDLGNRLFMLGNYDSAAQVFLKAQDSDKNLLGAATSLRFNEKDKDAIVYYTKLIGRNPNIAEAYFGRALSYRAIEEYEKAIIDLKNSLLLRESQYAYAGIVDLYILTNRNDLAKEYLEKGLSSFPNSQLLNSLKGRVTQ